MIRDLYAVWDSHYHLEQRRKEEEQEVEEEHRLSLRSIAEVIDDRLTGQADASPTAPEVAVITTDGRVRMYDCNGTGKAGSAKHPPNNTMCQLLPRRQTVAGWNRGRGAFRLGICKWPLEDHGQTGCRVCRQGRMARWGQEGDMGEVRGVLWGW